ncbi:putative phage-related membrane protein [Pectobacterium atrosepticum SCRI1043]|uniref:Phage-related membrane protein n=1 Tax=Pectobacterium atrosepticum (strain SCRI 1043 / ATCC BAA-672) TaxID=218491 RepID=Q6D0U0_PECAS|nr:hypothetical protein [Pectobacterium atrosepticum]AIA72729.1 hypothetical protein EV46_19630 [Pectobacterium atrosepticum]AIK15712.1 putative phage-related membrane protein [Pectobacterium atrosepticum]MCL6317817.1 hypothetical protein [Pectobacterium atrosepticum]MCL6322290.1 hypothetical protein [Pectobacterium atrosepticum]POW25418.1 hypothetical protein PB72LOC_03544 [Pectobacterium atrosepticum]
MDRREQELHSLAEQVMDSLKHLPQDGQERQITISVGGNNPGSIHVGSVVNINPAPTRSRELHERDSHELLTIKRKLLTKNKDAKWRCYFNIPCLLLLSLVLIAFAFALWNAYMMLFGGGLTNLLVLNEKTMVIFVSWGVIVMFCGKAMDKHRKIENRIIDENQNVIDTIDVILRRRNS